MGRFYGCSFFGAMKKEDLTPEIESHLRQLFVYLIFAKKVFVFYTAGKTDFDFICTAILTEIRTRYKFVSIVKVSKDYTELETDEYFAYDYVVPYENEDYEKHCLHILKKCRYIVLDSLDSIKWKINVFGDMIFEEDYFNKNFPRIYMVDQDEDFFVSD